MVDKLIEQARQAKKAVNDKSAQERKSALAQLAKQLKKNRQKILDANKKDVENAKNNGYEEAFIDRMLLTDSRFESIIKSLNTVAELEDNLGRVYDVVKQPSGITTSKMRVPIGTILMIYESRPNVTVEAASLAIKSGNVIILKGGSETIETNSAIGEVIKDSLQISGFPQNSVIILTDNARSLTEDLLGRDEDIDLLIPRGSKKLLRYVKSHSKIPALLHLEGNCHIYIDKDTDSTMAINITLNAKTQRFGTCNTLETLLIHKDVAKTILPEIAKKMFKEKVELRGDKEARAIVKEIKPATEQDWLSEYLAPILAVKVVDSLDEAVEHVNKYGSGHTDAIISSSQTSADEFINKVDSSSVMHNTSTRFADGFEYGLGAEIGISTGKIHARGPVGLEGLTTYKWVVTSKGMVRSD